MRFRLGFASGFATGYYLGAKAGQERYNQIRTKLNKLQQSETFHTAAEKAREVVGEGVEKAKAKAMEVVHRDDSNGSANGSNAATIAGTPGPASAYAPYASETPPDAGG